MAVNSLSESSQPQLDYFFFKEIKLESLFRSFQNMDFLHFAIELYEHNSFTWFWPTVCADILSITFEKHKIHILAWRCFYFSSTNIFLLQFISEVSNISFQSICVPFKFNIEGPITVQLFFNECRHICAAEPQI